MPAKVVLMQPADEFTDKHVYKPLAQMARRARLLARIIEECSDAGVALNQQAVTDAMVTGTLTIGVTGLATLLDLVDVDEVCSGG